MNQQDPQSSVAFVKFEPLENEGIEGGIWEDQTRVGVTANGERWIVKVSTDEESDEVVSYKIAEAFFNGIVPDTRLIILETGQKASAQRMVSGASAHDIEALGKLPTMVRNPKALLDMANMVALDFMIGNPDRHGNNWFIMNNGRIAAIDNGFAAEELDMPINRALRPVYKSLLIDDCKYSPMLLEIMRKVAQNIKGREDQAVEVCRQFSNSPKHALAGKWNRRVFDFVAGLDRWKVELQEHCNG